MPKVILGRRQLRSAAPYQTPEKDCGKRARLTSAKSPGQYTSFMRRADSTGVASSSSSSQGTKNAHIKKLEAIARATTQLKLDFESAESSGNVCLPWVDRNFPENLDELFVHKKKVEEVKTWLGKAVAADDHTPAKMCLLTGPTGSGKTATAYLVAKALDIEVKEWINPMNLTHFKEGNFDIPGDIVVGRNQLELFQDFLLRSSQYSSLPIKGKKRYMNRVIIVEDFPNALYRDTLVFHNILRNYNVNGTMPLIFIVADSSSGEFSPSKLFPKQILMDLSITQISFNPVAQTFLTKFLGAVCRREKISIESQLIDSVAGACSGDVRCAVNTLQFKILQQKPATKPKVGVKRPKLVTRDKMLTNSDLTQKDQALFLFRALGKVLYNKRVRTVEVPIELELKEELADHRRPFATQDVPEDIVNKIECSTETFLGFLHQNYLHFFGSIESCAKGASFLADSEVLLSKWNYEDNCGSKNFKNQDTRETLALSVGVRGLMYSNGTRVSSEWRALRKPLCGDIRAKVQKIKEDTRAILSSPESFLESYYYENIPFYARSLSQSLSADQRNFVRQVGVMKDSKQVRPRWLEILDENGIVEWEDAEPIVTDEAISSHLFQAKCVVSKPLIDAGVEEYFIDEFDDDD